MTELIWDGKYDSDGKKVAPLRVALPFQTVETVNESAQERQRTLDMFSAGRDPQWRNRLIWGDKKYVLPALLHEFAGKVDLIYIDPPFDTGADFSFHVEIDGEGFTKEPSIIEQKAYRDTWGRGRNSYLQWLYETVALLYDLLSPTGTSYIHLDWRMVHYARVLLDEIFGMDRFENEIVWQRSLPHGNVDYKFGASHDTLLRYTKTDEAVWHPQYTPHREQYLQDFYRYTEQDGRRYRLISSINPNPNRPNLTYEWRGVKKVWKFSRDRMQRMHDEGLLVYSKNGVPSYKGYLDQMSGVPMQDVWTDIPPLMGSSQEWTEYPTQKPEALLERVINASSDAGAVVLDCFAGSGTTAVVAEKLHRRWIAADLGRFAVHTTRKRLLSLPEVEPFIVQNLGKYERQLWQAAEFGEAAQRKVNAYRRFILDLYKATPITGYSWLHGLKGGRTVHVGAVDSPVTPGDLSQIAADFKKSVGTGKDAPKTNGVDVLGWDFAFDMNEAALSVDVQQKRLDVEVKLTDFVIPPDDVPEDVQRAITHWEQWIDYWAVDWDYKGDTFHNQWQDYRTRKKRDLQKSTKHTYGEPGGYSIVVKVIDILGNDTTKTINVKVAGDGATKATPARAARPARSAR